jgi:hypothetical protein
MTAAVSTIPDDRGSELRATLIRLAVGRKWCAVHFETREGVACVAIGRPCSVDARSVRMLHARDGDLYTVLLVAITHVEEIENSPPPQRQGDGR